MKLAPALCASACAVALLLPMRVGAAPAATPDDATTTEPPKPGPAEVERRDPSMERVLDDDKVYAALVREFTRNWQEGERQYQRKQFEQAARAFERAYAAMPFSDALYNVVLAYEEALDDVSAALAARRYLQLPSCDANVDASRCATKRSEVEEILARVLARLVEVQLDASTGVEVREIRVNGRTVRASAFPMLVEPGTVEIELLGRESWQRVLREPRLAAGETYVIRPTPFRTAPEPPRGNENGPVTPKRVRNTKALKGAFWGGVGVTAASGIALTTMGVLQLRERNKYEDMRCPEFVDPPGSCMYPQEHEDRAERYKLTTNVLIGVTAGVATITTILGIVAFSRRKTPSVNQRASTRVRLRPHVGGLTLSF